MKYFQLINIVLSACLLTSACSSTSAFGSKEGVSASDDELLATLASLARRGTTAVCDLKVLERELGIKIGELKLERRKFQGVFHTDYYYTDSIAAINDQVEVADSRFSRSQNNDPSCYLYIEFRQKRLCQTGNDRTEKIMGTSLVRGPTTPHRSDYGYYYFYKPSSGNSSEIYLGQSSTECASRFSLTVKGEWK